MTPKKYHAKMRLRFLCDQKQSALQGDLQVQIYDKEREDGTDQKEQQTDFTARV